MSQLKRFENKAQYIRYLHEETGIPIDELWEAYDEQIES
mgnify:CR=1 FL=1